MGYKRIGIEFRSACSVQLNYFHRTSSYAQPSGDDPQTLTPAIE